MDDYYPFGLTFNSYERENAAPNQFQYNSMELQDELSLNWLDYGARMYMPDIGRWGVPDPLSETSRRWSPYAYAYDNPIRFIDPDGMRAEDTNSNRPKEYENDHNYITVTYSGGPMSQSTNTVTETRTVSSGRFETDDEGNETFVERSTTTTTSAVIDADGELVSQSQEVTNSEKRTEVHDATQLHLFGPDETVKMKGKELSNTSSTQKSGSFAPSERFKQMTAMTSEYTRLNPGSSINFANTDYHSRMSRNPTIDGQQYGAMHNAMAWMSYAAEPNKQIYYDKFNGRVYQNNIPSKPDRKWSTGGGK